MIVLLIVIYWVIGAVAAAGLFSFIGMAINVLIALCRSVVRPGCLRLMFMYAFSAGISYLVVLGCLHLAGWIGDRTAYAGQSAMLAGAGIPGLLFLALVPSFVKIGLAQTSGRDA